MWDHKSYSTDPVDIAKLFLDEQGIQYDSLNILFPAYREDGSYCASFWVNDVEYYIKSTLSGNWEIGTAPRY